VVAEHPVFLTGAEIQAVLAGTKTQLRRVVKAPRGVDSKHWMPEACTHWCSAVHGGFHALHWPEDHAETKSLRCPFGTVGDVLWVRESWRISEPKYEATTENPEIWKWRSAICMPRHAARIVLSVTNVYLQHLQEISESDAQKEGVSLKCCDPQRKGLGPWCNCCPSVPERKALIDGFSKVWDNNSRPERHRWAANPRVWAVTFELLCR